MQRLFGYFIFFHDVQIVEMHSKGNNQIYARIWFLMIFVWMYECYELRSTFTKKGVTYFQNCKYNQFIHVQTDKNISESCQVTKKRFLPDD